MQKLFDEKAKESGKEEEKTEDDKFDGLDDKVKEATKAMEFEEKKTEIEIQKQKSEIGNLQHLVEIAALRMREKDQEKRLCELKIKEIKRQTRHTALKPLEHEPKSAREPESDVQIYRPSYKTSTIGRSENSNIQGILNQGLVGELTEENIKLHEETMKEYRGDDDYEFYSDFEESSEKDRNNKPDNK